MLYAGGILHLLESRLRYGTGAGGEDKEGLMTMYNIGKNMAWMLKCFALGKENGIGHPENEKVLTNFVR